MAREDEYANPSTNPLYNRPRVVAENAAMTDKYTPKGQEDFLKTKEAIAPVTPAIVPKKPPSRIGLIAPIALSNATDGDASARVYPTIGANQLPANRIQQIGDAQYVLHPSSHVGSGIPTDPNFQPPAVPKAWGNKGHGYFGALKRPDGKVSTELDVGVKLDGPDGEETRIPLLVPTQSHDDIQHLLSGKKETPAMLQAAITHAQARKQRGLSPFAHPGERYDLPPPPSDEAYIPPGYVETIRGTQRSLHNPTTNRMADSGNVMDYQNSVLRRTNPELVGNQIQAEAAKAVAGTHAGATIESARIAGSTRISAAEARADAAVRQAEIANQARIYGANIQHGDASVPIPAFSQQSNPTSFGIDPRTGQPIDPKKNVPPVIGGGAGSDLPDWAVAYAGTTPDGRRLYVGKDGAVGVDQ